MNYQHDNDDTTDRFGLELSASTVYNTNGSPEQNKFTSRSALLSSPNAGRYDGTPQQSAETVTTATQPRGGKAGNLGTSKLGSFALSKVGSNLTTRDLNKTTPFDLDDELDGTYSEDDDDDDEAADAASRREINATLEPLPQPLNNDGSPKYLSSTYFAIIIQYVCVGLYIGFFDGTAFPVFSQLLQLPSYRAKAAIQSINIWWSCKIFLAAISDSFPIFGYRRRPYIFFGWLMATVVTLCTIFYPGQPTAETNPIALTMMFSAITFFYLLGDIAMDANIIALSQREPIETRGSIQSTAYLSRYISMIFSGLVMALGFNGKSYGGEASWELKIPWYLIFLFCMNCCALPFYITIWDKKVDQIEYDTIDVNKDLAANKGLLDNNNSNNSNNNNNNNNNSSTTMGSNTSSALEYHQQTSADEHDDINNQYLFTNPNATTKTKSVSATTTTPSTIKKQQQQQRSFLDNFITLYNRLQLKVVIKCLLFAFFVHFFVFIHNSASYDVQKQLCRVQPIHDGLISNVGGSLFTSLSIWFTKRYLLSVSWHKTLFCCILFLATFTYIPAILIDLNFLRSPYFATMSTLLTTFINGTFFVISAMCAIDIAAPGTEGMTYALMTTINNLVNSITILISTNLMRQFNIYHVDGITINDTQHGRWQLFSLDTTIFFIQLLALFPLLLLPKQKLQLKQELKKNQSYKYAPFFTKLFIGFLCCLFIYGLVGNFLMTNESTACLKFIGGKGCH